ncbi:metal dependent phosphohydrolase [Gottschalkia purinilytica]|uniref:Metal dependent phosphohydrolase n=1 Tax=Gottschalkia purinilytica TaxID=1503 RepID=A0A0L0WD26_GOTPU|nr:HDIG domain-containing metalloprotein [Gottschalkia purinilytica]KNF09346.1 metal dependent phosphohydrolase [Gottschalkia purinilytica]
MLFLLEKNLKKFRKTQLYKTLSKPKAKYMTLGIIFTSILFILIMISIVPERISVRVGDISPKDIRATKDIVDEVTTEKFKLEAMEKVEPKYRIDTSIQIKVKSDIRKFFELVKRLYNDNDINLSDKEKEDSLLQQEYVKLSSEECKQLLTISPETLLTLESNIYEVINQIMGVGIKEEELKYEKNNVAKTFENFDNLTQESKLIGAKIVKDKIQPNKFVDMETTQQKREEAAERVDPVIIKEGQIITERNKTIDKTAYSLIKKTGLLKENKGIDYTLIFGALILTILIETIIMGYLYVFDRKVIYNFKLLVILAIIILLISMIAKSIYGLSGYMIPISSATILISILINPRLSILINIILSIIIGITTSSELSILIVCLISGIVGAFATVNTQQRYNIFLIGLLVGTINIITILGFGLAYSLEFNEILRRSIYGMTNGVISSILAIGSLPLWENIFNILTPLKLLELMNPNQPLLKRLLIEAPGTYHHSIIVGNLSEGAAEVVDANALIARVGAYYHDIGKLKRPYFFKENQKNGENPHDKINPNLSALVITNHTKDGIELACKHRLPEEIKDIIKQHHGKTLVAYFYHKALNEEGSEFVQEERFRYEGPKPQSKEAAIVMLADSAEAAVKAMKDPTKGKIEVLVRKIIKDKLNDGQLDECGLTLGDLNKIANSFMNTFMGIYHERIEYPNLNLAELKGGN